MDWTFEDGILISTDREKLSIEVVHGYLSRSYWASNIPLALVRRAINHSLCFGIYDSGEMIGFGRVITDYTTFGYLSDIFILESHRGRGYSKLLVSCMLKHPELSQLRRWHLVTRDAQGLYAQFGFQTVDQLDQHMSITIRNAYGSEPSARRDATENEGPSTSGA